MREFSPEGASSVQLAGPRPRPAAIRPHWEAQGSQPPGGVGRHPLMPLPACAIPRAPEPPCTEWPFERASVAIPGSGRAQASLSRKSPTPCSPPSPLFLAAAPLQSPPPPVFPRRGWKSLRKGGWRESNATHTGGAWATRRYLPSDHPYTRPSTHMHPSARRPLRHPLASQACGRRWLCLHQASRGQPEMMSPPVPRRPKRARRRVPMPRGCGGGE
jgi:hypothetical protein